MARDWTVYVTREIPDAGLELLSEDCDVHVWDGTLPPSKEHIRERLRELNADGLLCLLSDDVDGSVMDATPNLDVISTFSVGYDHVDVNAARDRGIALGHTPGVLAETTADFTWALMLAAARRVPEGQDFALSGDWETWGPKALTGQDVHDATLGIVGLGEIGTAVARRAAGFGMDVLYDSPRRKQETEADLDAIGVDAEWVDLPRLLAESDFVSLHVPLTRQTEGLIGEYELRRMKRDAILINTSRGEVVDTDALDTALDRGWIGRAAVDVTDPEPLPPDHDLTRHVPEKLLLTPHIASASVQTRDRMATMAAENLLAGLAGDPLPNPVDTSENDQ